MSVKAEENLKMVVRSMAELRQAGVIYPNDKVFPYWDCDLKADAEEAAFDRFILTHCRHLTHKGEQLVIDGVRIAGIDVQSLIEVVDGYWNDHRHYYHVPARQIPYLHAIDFGDIATEEIALPAGVPCLKFTFDSEVQPHCGILMRWGDHSLSYLCRHGKWWGLQTMGRDDRPIEAHLAEAANVHGDCPENEIKLAMLRQTINCLFLADCSPHFFKPDVLAADRQKYQDAAARADQEAVQRFKRRAIARKGTGFVFDTGERWEVDLGFVGPGDPAQPDLGGSRSFSYIRRGHWRRVRYGAGRQFAKRLFIAPTICRPDLAPKPR
jgi:hypothetical protein